MKKRFKSFEEAVNAIRQEPAFRSLVSDLKTREPQVHRLEKWIDDQIEKELTNEKEV